MPPDFIIKTGDMIKITIPPPAIIPMIEAPVPLVGTGETVTVMGSPICLEGDELPIQLRTPIPYTAPPFVTPGMGMIQVFLIPGVHTTLLTSNKKPILIKGSVFQAMFNVEAPAMQPTPAGPIPDPLLAKPGTAQFITTNATVKAG
jgi:hypothetical protein